MASLTPPPLVHITPSLTPTPLIHSHNAQITPIPRTSPFSVMVQSGFSLVYWFYSPFLGFLRFLVGFSGFLREVQVLGVPQGCVFCRFCSCGGGEGDFCGVYVDDAVFWMLKSLGSRTIVEMESVR
ncbi:hypothetical protein E2C01_072120 [Portunus trituberculatus]|uniref:Uncharacterized protein n=1 Tax=Portunus trituberculatus TaxID=210409 RepID=A0A5B7HX65_PORTR|nr:hypothetical protein [Portunus trituberculatus]